jgi:hypothetical protein
MGLLDFTARLCNFGLGARDLSAGVRTELLGVGLRGQRGLRRLRSSTFRLGSSFFDFRLSARDLDTGVRTELLDVGLRGQRGLRRFRAGTLRVGSRYFHFDVGRGDFAARVV